MFDPEKVERVNIDNEDRHDIVLASDYDRLLVLYRKLLRDWNQGLNDSRHAAAMNYGQRDPQTP